MRLTQRGKWVAAQGKPEVVEICPHVLAEAARACGLVWAQPQLPSGRQVAIRTGGGFIPMGYPGPKLY